MMYKKAFKYLTAIIALIVIIINSVYFKKLDEVKAASLSGQFDAASYARNFWDNKLIPSLNNAIDLNLLITLLEASPEETFREHSNALGIGNIRFFFVRGEGEIIAINENDVSVLLEADSGQKVVKIATEYVFGNAVRDASGAININAFDNTMDFNHVSAEINKIIRAEVLPPFNARAKAHDMVEFFGAVQLNKAHLNLENIEVIPISLKALDNKTHQTP